MSDILVPSLGESITEATIAKWYKKVGDQVNIDELLLEIETDKVTLEVNAVVSGVISDIAKNEGDTVTIGEVVGKIKEGASKGSSSANIAPSAQTNEASRTAAQESSKHGASNNSSNNTSSKILSPAAQKIAAENNVDTSVISASGKDGRITKHDALQNINSNINSANSQTSSSSSGISHNRVEKVRMSRLRQTIAKRLKDSQNTAAILTTFNEVDMSAVMSLRKKYKDVFEKQHNIKLGFMSFFVQAVVRSLKEIPTVNAEIDGEYIIYKNYYDIGVAVGTKTGLVVPILRDADKLSFAETEAEIINLAEKAKDGKLKMEDLSGGTFSISNGGVYGSLLSTPIINPPQSGILGMHKIQEKAVVIDGEIKIRPMMYLALSYDHRIIDGKEAVTFLVKVKQYIEDPQRMLLDI